jgi:AAHS family 4-hydroxybenzoate transporter-like MFS transporter
MATDGTTLHAESVINQTKAGKFQILVLVLGALVLFTDGFNTHDLGYVAFDVRDELGLSQATLGLVLSAGIAGLLAGYVLLSPLGGYLGPKRMVVTSVAGYGVFAILCSFAQDATQLIILRFFTGMALASAIPATVAIVGEFAPMPRRSSFITFSYFGLSLGQLSGGIAASLLLEDFGWRGVLFSGGLIALGIVPILYFLMPESIEYLVNRRKQPAKALKMLKRAVPHVAIEQNAIIQAGEKATQRVAVPELFNEGRTLGTLLIWLAIMMNLIPNYFFGNWLTTILVDTGFTDNQAIYVKMANDGAGMMVAFIAGPLMDRYGPYRVMACFFLGGAIVVAATGITLTYGLFFPMLTMAFFVGFFTSGVSKGSNAVGVHFYPTALRSAGVGWGLGIGRIGAFVAPIIAGILLGLGWAPHILFYMAAAPLLIGMVAQLTLHIHYGEKRVSQVAASDAGPATASPSSRGFALIVA